MVIVRSDGRLSDGPLRQRNRYLSTPTQTKANCPTIHTTRTAAIPSVYLLNNDIYNDW